MVQKKNPYGYIYKATNIENGKVYVGQTITERWKPHQVPIKQRWAEEVRKSNAIKRKREANPNKTFIGRYIHNAIIKYGPDKFKLEQKDVAVNQKELDEKETHWIKECKALYPNGYNMIEGGRGGRMAPEVKEKLSQISKEFWKNSKERQAQSIRMKEMLKDPKIRERMSKAQKIIQFLRLPTKLI